MTDRIVLHDMRFQGHHGQTVEEQERVQPFEVDVELPRDLQRAGVSDDLTTTIDYSTVYDLCKSIVEARTYHLLEAIAEAIAGEILATFDAEEVTVRVRKPAVRLSGPIGYAGVEIHRRRSPR
jgi:dihydroneopterin aldolase